MRASNGRQDVAQGASLMRKIEGHGWPGFCSNNVGRIAQSVEQRTENPCVGGSIPPSATTSNFPPNTRKTLSILYFFFFISGASALLYHCFCFYVRFGSWRFSSREIYRIFSTSFNYFLSCDRIKHCFIWNIQPQHHCISR